MTTVTDPKHQAAIRRLFPIVQVEGWQLLEHPALRYDEVRLDRASRTAIVGEIAQVMYQSDLNAIKEAMRHDLRRTMSEFRRRVGVA